MGKRGFGDDGLRYSPIMTCVSPIIQGGNDAQVHQHLDPGSAYRYAVECCQPHLKLRDAKRVTARCSCPSSSPPPHASPRSPIHPGSDFAVSPTRKVVAAALYETLPDYNLLK